jgi:hypothetical protein
MRRSSRARSAYGAMKIEDMGEDEADQHGGMMHHSFQHSAYQSR